jgi:hypothetical protein
MATGLFQEPPTKQWWVRFSIILLGSILLVSTVASLRVTNQNVDTTPPTGIYGEVKIVAPQDGDLSVGSVTVSQIPGSCTDQGCRFEPKDPASLPTVNIPAGQSVDVSSQRSATFSANVTNGTRPAPTLNIVGGRLVTDATMTGEWTLTVSGTAGGMWQFNVNLT